MWLYYARGRFRKAISIIKKIYTEKDKLKGLGNNGFQYALNNFTINVCLDKLEKLF